jgi:leucyl aminopeptidase
MDEDLKKILGEEEQETIPSEEPKDPNPEAQEEDPEVAKKAEQLANLNKAIQEAQKNLKDARKAKKEPKDEEEDVLPINLEDENSKAWDSHIRKTVAPVAQEMEKEKEEVRTFALREFLTDHPDLARDPEKLKTVMGTYDRIKTASERTTQGVLIDLGKAYRAEYGEELERSSQEARRRQAQDDLVFSEPGVSRGATGYQTERELTPRITQDEADQLRKWGMTPKEYFDLKKKYPS